MKDLKNKILNVSLKYFFQNGIRKTSNARLVSILGISTKTLYKHFKNKEDLLEQALELFYSQQYEHAKELPSKQSAVIILYNLWKSGFDREFQVNNQFYHDLGYYYSGLEKRIEAKNKKRFDEQFILVINRGLEEGELRSDMNSNAVLEAFSQLYVAVVRKGTFDGYNISKNDLFNSTVLPYLRGICTEKGIKILDEYLSKSIITKCPG